MKKKAANNHAGSEVLILIAVPDGINKSESDRIYLDRINIRLHKLIVRFSALLGPDDSHSPSGRSVSIKVDTCRAKEMKNKILEVHAQSSPENGVLFIFPVVLFAYYFDAAVNSVSSLERVHPVMLLYGDYIGKQIGTSSYGSFHFLKVTHVEKCAQGIFDYVHKKISNYKTAAITDLLLGVIEMLARVIENRDAYLYHHSLIVSLVARKMIKAICGTKSQEYSPAVQEAIQEHHKGLSWIMQREYLEINVPLYAGLVHDLGKVGIPDYLLHLPRVYTVAQRDEMNAHVEAWNLLPRKELLQHDFLLSSLHSVVRDHHVHPAPKSKDHEGLEYKDVSALAKVIRIGDCFHAGISMRPYDPPKKAYSVFPSTKDNDDDSLWCVLRLLLKADIEMLIGWKGKEPDILKRLILDTTGAKKHFDHCLRDALGEKWEETSQDDSPSAQRLVTNLAFNCFLERLNWKNLDNSVHVEAELGLFVLGFPNELLEFSTVI